MEPKGEKTIKNRKFGRTCHALPFWLENSVGIACLNSVPSAWCYSLGQKSEMPMVLGFMGSFLMAVDTRDLHEISVRRSSLFSDFIFCKESDLEDLTLSSSDESERELPELFLSPAQ